MLACAVSGLVADARTLIERARTEAAHHWFVYNEKMTIEDVTKAVSNLALAFGDDDMESGAMVKNLACAVSGLVADARTLIERARTEAAHHWFVYNEKMTIEDVTKAVSNLALAFGDDDMESGAMSRPFGVALLFAGVDERGPQLYHMDPSGTYIRYEAKAIGSGSEGAQQALQEIYHKVNCFKIY
ncbi:20S proteasome subunit alpha 5 [Schistosoma bovis]|uniref:20S proteasome subunit alpha 5 n=1 Tax=Schistosoma bovis TaxID=6184 RepID=A0A430Q4F8_SCHBO|nr:20S proteasome subunit alpha 5 [Schistosoma bovis]